MLNYQRDPEGNCPKADAVGVTDVIQKIQAAPSSLASMDPAVECQGGLLWALRPSFTAAF